MRWIALKQIKHHRMVEAPSKSALERVMDLCRQTANAVTGLPGLSGGIITEAAPRNQRRVRPWPGGGNGKYPNGGWQIDDGQWLTVSLEFGDAGSQLEIVIGWRFAGQALAIPAGPDSVMLAITDVDADEHIGAIMLLFFASHLCKANGAVSNGGGKSRHSLRTAPSYFDPTLISDHAPTGNKDHAESDQ
ncbi:hypothetical protein B7759_03877 [Burkholderia glumae]|nr:hypothetical protein KS03_3479 [Burkholderia glumae LMG 2196 = ATCC 33617]KHJ64830.1 hypothetical protein NCPPB3923_00880 [Burkholderia glumae]QKM55320.1 hypothetical protein CG017_03379 [Burkholderia glumae]QTP35254.1 hypothetical protein B7759_03877 [Burkholderia glumae]